MRMAENDHIRPLASDSALEIFGQRLRVYNVMYQKLPARQGNHFGRAIIHSGIVSIARHSGGRCDRFQLQNDRLRSDIAGVQNMLYSAEKARDLRIQKIVSVRNDADFHRCAFEPAPAFGLRLSFLPLLHCVVA